MVWADRIVSEIRNTCTPRNGKSFLIRDEKTLSGRVHIGSMRGVAIHGLISEVLNENDIKNEFRFELNDFDPFDSIPGYLDEEKFKPYLGKPLYTVPSPEEGFGNYAEYFGAEFIEVHKKAGFTPSYYRATELYQSGKMDTLIRTALERASDVRRILKEVSGSEKDASWLPISVVCEKCGKIMTTRALDFDGETVAYHCDRNPDDIQSCGHTGRIAPWSGTAKLFWKVEWAAKWVAQKVDIEGGGKDHSTKGGSRDVANHIAREVFDYEPPFDIPYEFFLVGGKKMSSSKGRGSSAKDMADLFPPELLRFVLIGKDIREQIDVDPSGDSVPRLYDLYDEIAESARVDDKNDQTRLYELCMPPAQRNKKKLLWFSNVKEVPWSMRFREVAFMVQMPHLFLFDEAVRAKGSPLTKREERNLKERAHYAAFWLENYAPEEFKYELQNELPSLSLSEAQKAALTALSAFFSEKRDGEETHLRLHELKTEIPIAPQELFKVIYKIFLNRDSGPKAGWFLASLPQNFVESRIDQALR